MEHIYLGSLGLLFGFVITCSNSHPASVVGGEKRAGAKLSLPHTVKKAEQHRYANRSKNMHIPITYQIYISSINPFPFAFVNYSSYIWILKPAYKYRKLTTKNVSERKRKREREKNTQSSGEPPHHIHNNNRMRINFDEFMDISHSMDEQKYECWRRVKESERGHNIEKASTERANVRIAQPHTQNRIPKFINEWHECGLREQWTWIRHVYCHFMYTHYTSSGSWL